MARIFRVGRGALIAPLLSLVAPAQAQEYCIACTGPDAVYRCQIVNMGPAQRQPLKLLCVTTLARDGKHASCATRDGTVLECGGPIKQVDVLGKPAETASAAAAPTEPYVVPERKTVVDESGPPKTVEEAVRRASKSTGDGVSSAGKSISDGAKKTWNCVTSLFKAC